MNDTTSPDAPPPLARTPLYDLHARRGARFVPFAGYEMPVHYGEGILAEHAHTRSAAGLFDVSHMGQAFLIGPDHETTARALEALTPADILNLPRGRQRYTQILNAEGGILDDLMVTRPADPDEDGVLMLVVNAARKEADFAHISAHLPAAVKLMRADHRGLIALQGPKAAEVLARHVPDVVDMPFMTAQSARFAGMDCHISRSGYTGEDGFEISVNAKRIGAVVERLLDSPAVRLIGLGARDSLRLEAGFCLYGHDIDETTSPVEAALAWSIQTRRREEGGFPGAARILSELAHGPERLRVGLLPEGRVPAREGAEIRASDGAAIGRVTSGGYGATVGGPIAMGYVSRRFAEPDTPVVLIVRGKEIAAKVVPLPFVPHRYHRAPAASAPSASTQSGVGP
ncbi:MAG: glycine cleavage system aminomethyltransferase GcvT [Variibacter sp.]|nr:glycine cleavage system aminomethyltransferase GcvT [Variibacter sp.]